MTALADLVTRRSGDGGQHDDRGGAAVDTLLVHHAASSNLDEVLSMMATGSREVSSNLVIRDDDTIEVVSAERRAWTSASSEWDSRSITVEVVNSATGDASGWLVSEASMASLARVGIAMLADYPGFRAGRDRVLGHRELYERYGASYPTACPGGIDLEDLVARIRAGSTTTQNQDHTMYLVELLDDGRVFLVTPSGFSYVERGSSLAGLDALGLPRRKMWFGHFIDAMAEIHEAHTADAEEFSDLRTRLEALRPANS